MTPIGPARRLVSLALVLAFGAATPALAAHRARLSADLEDHVRAGSAAVNVIVHGTRSEVEALAARYNLRIVKYLKHGAVVRGSGGDIAALQQDDAVDHLSADIRYRSHGDITAQSIGADQVWAGGDKVRGLRGRGIGVAVIDSGVDPKHAALRGRVAASIDFTGGNGVDSFGHGTHVAAIIAGAAGRLVETQDYRGIAPGARIINLRVLGADGSGLASDVIQAIDWAIDNRKAYNIQVINLSLGAPVTQPYRDDPVCEAVERAVAAGIVVVAAAGNFGQTADGRAVYGGITSPGNDPSVITVGAVDTHRTAVRSDDTVAKYSSRGPTRYDLVLKPDLVAPGSGVVSAEAAASYLAATYPARHVAGAGADAYMQLSGTSMAAGVVSGAVALLLEQKAKLTPRKVKTILQLTSEWLAGEGLLASGTGSLNVLAAAGLLTANSSGFPATTSISGQPISRSGIAFSDTSGIDKEFAFVVTRRHKQSARTQEIVWYTSANDTIIWSTGETIILTNSEGSSDTIIWSTVARNETIIWTATDTIVWTNANSDTIIWSSHSPYDDSSDVAKGVWSGSRHDQDTIIWSIALEQ